MQTLPTPTTWSEPRHTARTFATAEQAEAHAAALAERYPSTCYNVYGADTPIGVRHVLACYDGRGSMPSFVGYVAE